MAYVTLHKGDTPCGKGRVGWCEMAAGIVSDLVKRGYDVNIEQETGRPEPVQTERDLFVKTLDAELGDGQIPTR